MGLQGFEPWLSDYESGTLPIELQAPTPIFGIPKIGVGAGLYNNQYTKDWCEGLRLHTYKRYRLDYNILFY